MSWTYRDTDLFGAPLGYVGFVYLITNLKNNRKYIGQKGFYSKVTKPPLKGRKLKRRSLTESNWLDYYGSSVELGSDVQVIGRDGFHREILHLCKSKSEMNYLEIKEQIIREVLLTDEYYNGFIGGKIHKKHVASLRL